MSYEPSTKHIAVRVNSTVHGLLVKSVFDGEITLEWPLAGTYRIRRHKQTGQWKSVPMSFLQKWTLTPDAVEAADRMILEEAQFRSTEQKKRRGTL